MEAEGWIEFKKNGFIRLLSTRIKDNKNGRKNLKINIEKGDGTRDIIQKLREAIISKTIRKQNYILRKETNSQIKHVATGLISDIPLGVKGMSEVLRCSKSTASREKKNFRFITTRHKISFHKNMSEAELLYFQTDEPSGKWIRLRNGDVMHQQADLFTLHKKPIAKAKKVKAPKGKGFSVTNGGSAAVKTEEEYKEMSLDDCKLEAAIAQHEFDEKYGTHRWRSFNRRACRD